MRYSMKRAIAFVLSLTMALALPLTASAENSLITDIYEEDGSVGRVPQDPNYSITESGSGTGTDTASHPIKDEGDGENDWNEKSVEARILDVVLDADEIEIEAGFDTSKTVTATVIFENGQKLTPDQMSQIYRMLRWQWVPGPQADPNDEWSTARVSVAKVGQFSNECKLTGLSGGTGYIRVWIDNDTNGTSNEWDSTEAGREVPAVVKEYATELRLREDAKDAKYFQKQKIDLNNLVAAYDAWGNEIKGWKEAIGWTVEVPAGSTAKATIDAKGVAKLTKAGNIVFHGISERGARIEINTEILSAAEANAVKKFTVADKKPILDYKDGANPEKSLKATVECKKGGTTTDYLTWSVKNPDIVSLKDVNSPLKAGLSEATATVVAKKVGKTTVTVTASSGAKFNFTVTVQATVTGLDLSYDKTIYVGQSVKLNVTPTPIQSAATAKYTWSVDQSCKKYVSVKNGVLTVNAKAVGNIKEFSVTVTEKKSKQTDTYKFTPAMAALDGSAMGGTLAQLVKRTKLPGTDKVSKDELYKRQKKNYTEALKLEDIPVYEGGVDSADILSWISGKTTVADIGTQGDAVALGAGTSKLTVTGLVYKNRKYSVQKATVSLKVKQPVTRLQLKQTDVSLVQKANGSYPTATIKVSKYLPKGSTKIKNGTVWNSADESLVKVTKPLAGKIQGANGAAVGQDTIVTVTETNGATAKATVTLCKKTTAVEVTLPSQGGYIKSVKTTTKKNNEKADVLLFDEATGLTKENKGFVISAQGVASGQFNEAVISCTAKGKGGVQIVPTADKGSYKIIPVKAGKVTLTFKTASGKSGKCTLNIVTK